MLGNNGSHMVSSSEELTACEKQTFLAFVEIKDSTGTVGTQRKMGLNLCFREGSLPSVELRRNVC